MASWIYTYYTHKHAGIRRRGGWPSSSQAPLLPTYEEHDVAVLSPCRQVHARTARLVLPAIGPWAFGGTKSRVCLGCVWPLVCSAADGSPVVIGEHRGQDQPAWDLECIIPHFCHARDCCELSFGRVSASLLTDRLQIITCHPHPARNRSDALGHVERNTKKVVFIYLDAQVYKISKRIIMRCAMCQCQ